MSQTDIIPTLRPHVQTLTLGGRTHTHITPEGLGDALTNASPHDVARELLAVIGKQAGIGVEDAALCAFIAWRALDGAK